jgi:hypothetical protein
LLLPIGDQPLADCQSAEPAGQFFCIILQAMPNDRGLSGVGARRKV